MATAALSLALSAGPASAQPETTPAPEIPTSASELPSTEPSTPTSPETPSAEPSAQPSSSSPEPPPAAEPAPVEPRAATLDARPEIDVIMVFDKPQYQTGDLIKVDFSVKNLGSEPLGKVSVSTSLNEPDDLVSHNYDEWAGLRHSQGVTIEPGASYTVRITGYGHRAESEAVRLSGVVFAGNSGVKEFAASAPIVKTYGRASGTVFGDKNGNGLLDAGEGLPGVKLNWKSWDSYQDPTVYTATSDADGSFTFPNLPTIRYSTGTEQVDGWHLLRTTVKVDQSGTDGVRIRAIRSVKDTLKAEMAFDKDVYQPGELAHVTVKLTNTGSVPHIGIVANCNRGGFGHSLNGDGPGWEVLHPLGTGVTVPAGQTLTLDVAETVPHVAFIVGKLHVGCDFGPAGWDNALDLPVGLDDALVPGGRGGLKTTVSYFPTPQTPWPGEPVAGVKVVVVNDLGCNLGEKVTDEKGVAELSGLPAGQSKYSLYYFAPAGWMMKTENPQTQLDVTDSYIASQNADAAPGEGQHPVLPAPSPECGQQPPAGPPGTQPPGDQPVTPNPQGKVVKLANTGANVFGLGTAGMVLLLLGTGAVVATRRRRDHPVLHQD